MVPGGGDKVLDHPVLSRGLAKNETKHGGI